MLDPNVAPSLALTVASANSASSADGASSLTPAAGNAATEAADPFAAVLQRHLAAPNTAKIAKDLKELMHIEAKADTAVGEQAVETPTDPAAMLAWLGQIFGTSPATPAATDATAATDAAAIAEDASELMPVVIAAPVAGNVATSETNASVPNDAFDALAQNRTGVPVPLKDASAAAGPGSEAGADPAFQASSETAAPGSAILAAANPGVAESAAASGNAGQLLQSDAQGAAGAAIDASLHSAPAAAIAHAHMPTGTTAKPAATAAVPVTTPVGAQGWSNEVGDRVNWMIGRQETRAELVLNPPQMGRIEVSLSMNGNQANAIFVSANPAVREALENAVPHLREVLQDAGIALGQAHVGAESFQQQASRGHEKDDNSGRGVERPDGAMTGPLAAAGQAIRQGNGLVDTFA